MGAISPREYELTFEVPQNWVASRNVTQLINIWWNYDENMYHYELIT